MNIFYPEDRTGYETIEAMQAKHEFAAAQAVRSFPGASSEREAILMALCQAHSIISGAKTRLEAMTKKES
jgi:hypothetical protein